MFKGTNRQTLHYYTHTSKLLLSTKAKQRRGYLSYVLWYHNNMSSFHLDIVLLSACWYYGAVICRLSGFFSHKSHACCAVIACFCPPSSTGPAFCCCVRLPCLALRMLCRPATRTRHDRGPTHTLMLHSLTVKQHKSEEEKANSKAPKARTFDSTCGGRRGSQ